MFNNFKLSDNETIKIINDYEPLILKSATLNRGFDEDLEQEIKLSIYKELTKNRKKFKNFWEFETSTKNFGLLLVDKKKRRDKIYGW